MNGIMAPWWSPQKWPFCRGKMLQVPGPCPLGAAMDSSAFLTAARSTATTGAYTREVLPQRGHDLRRQLSREGAARNWGSMSAPHGPRLGTPRKCRLQEKSTTPEGAAPLGAQMGSSGFACLDRDNYCHNGDTGGAPDVGRFADRMDAMSKFSIALE
jgi:hypothetical protein